MKARDVALEALNHLNTVENFSNQYLEHVFKRDKNITKRDRAFVYNIVQGVLRWRLRFDWIIKQYVQFPFNKIHPSVLNILHISLYQIYYMDRVPESAAVNEAVKQVKASKKRNAAGFVNGILRQICRHKTQINFPDKNNDPVKYLSAFYSYPEWLIKKWIKELDIDSTESLLDAGNRIPDLFIRTNKLKIDRSGLINILEKEGVNASPSKSCPEGIRIEGLKGQVIQLEAFRNGLIHVQSEAAQICSHFLNPQPGEVVLDLCAGLGGKSTHLAELMGGRGGVLALDISHDRLVMLVENSLRLGIDCIQPVVADACSNLHLSIRGVYDKIFVDAPCSGLGNLSRHPDGKWSRDEEDIKRLSVLQMRIINEAVPLLKVGGKLLYVTCTISREENEGVVTEFLRKNKSMILENLNDTAPEWALKFINEKGFFNVLPHVHGMDGFFAALFKKKV